MKFFIDTEFVEHQKKGIPTIDLISIAVASENPKMPVYYAVSNEFDLMAAWYLNESKQGETPVYWIRQNVLLPIFKEWIAIELQKKGKVADELQIASNFSYDNFEILLKKHGKSRGTIAHEIELFVSFHNGDNDTIQFLGYYCAYDWVLFCWLYGTLMSLPEMFPEICIDIEQIRLSLPHKLTLPPQTSEKHSAKQDAIWIRDAHSFIIDSLKE